MTVPARPHLAASAADTAVAKDRLLLGLVLNPVALIARSGAAWLPVT
jgi:hypothetical protein